MDVGGGAHGHGHKAEEPHEGHHDDGQHQRAVDVHVLARLEDARLGAETWIWELKTLKLVATPKILGLQNFQA